MYKVVADEKDIKKFAELFIPNEEHYITYFELVARQKYDPTLSKYKILLTRVMVPGVILDNRQKAIEEFYRAVLRLETAIGSYSDIPVPNQSLVVYGHLEYQDTLKVLSNVLNEYIQNRTGVGVGVGVTPPNMWEKYTKELEGSKAAKVKYRQIDLDTKDEEKIEQVKRLFNRVRMNEYLVMAIETRNGYHIIYEYQDKIDHRQLFEFTATTKFTKLNTNNEPITDYWFSLTRHPRVVIPGTYQGGFATRITDIFTD